MFPIQFQNYSAFLDSLRRRVERRGDGAPTCYRPQWIVNALERNRPIYKGWIKSKGNSSIFMTCLSLFTEVQHIRTFNIVALLFITYAKYLEELYTISASIFVNVPYRSPYSTDRFISCVVTGPSQWFFHFGEEIAWNHIGWVRWIFQRHKRSVTTAVRRDSLHCHEEWWGFRTIKCCRFLLIPAWRWFCR